MLPVKDGSCEELRPYGGIFHSENNFIIERCKSLKINIAICICQHLLERKAKRMRRRWSKPKRRQCRRLPKPAESLKINIAICICQHLLERKAKRMRRRWSKPKRRQCRRLPTPAENLDCLIFRATYRPKLSINLNF